MGRYTGPKVKLSRRVGVPIADIPKHTAKELNLPGMHGYRGRRNTEYGVRLTEKQKLRFHYGMLEKQFRMFLDIAKKSKGNTASSLMQILETAAGQRPAPPRRRPDDLGRPPDRRPRPRDGRRPQDRHRQLPRRSPARPITFKEGIHKLLRENMEQSAGHNVPGWLEWNPAQLTGKVNAAADAGRRAVRSEHEPDHRVLSVMPPEPRGQSDQIPKTPRRSPGVLVDC